MGGGGGILEVIMLMFLYITGKYNNNACSCSSGHTFVGGPTKVHLLILANPCCGPSDHGPKLAGERKKKKKKREKKKERKKGMIITPI